MIGEIIVCFIIGGIIAFGLHVGLNELELNRQQDLAEKEFLKTASCNELELFILDDLRNGTKINGEQANKIYEKVCIDQ